MTQQITNQYGQPIGELLPNWTTVNRPEPITLTGHYCRLEPLNADRHANTLYAALRLSGDDSLWTYLPYGPFHHYDDYYAYVKQITSRHNEVYFAIINSETNKAVGSIALRCIDNINGSIEVGHVVFSVLLKKTRIATEAQYLLMQYVFDQLGYRRYEWRCNSLNASSKAAATRLGFAFEGIFRQTSVHKQRNRDTAWFSLLDYEWPSIKTGMQQWLDARNFNQSGEQLKSLSDCIKTSEIK